MANIRSADYPDSIEVISLPDVVPQGLKSFGEDAKGFFLRLLPGPYRENGLPESLHLWKRQIEQTDADETFRVGVIYGKSGCGKSSWIKAGLLPRLDGVTTVYVEAIPDGTPQRLLAALRKRCPWLDEAASLVETLQHKDRIPASSKVLIVLDQFEQWLHGRREEDYGELLDALRACDGTRMQCLLLIRSDFFDLLVRFLDHLQVRLEQSKNLAIFDVFDQRHARNVLTLFGQAYGALPKSGALTADQDSFRSQAVNELADETGRIACVRLSLFAEMLKLQEWTPATLRPIGGTSGVGFAFLEENFSTQDAPQQYRRHEAAARAVLEQLLPAVGTDIKGAMRSEDALRSRSGYERRPDDFAELLKILNQELRLITPTAPVEATSDGQMPQTDAPGVATARAKYYQLTHDYLVPSLREWLIAKQRETWRGRAFLLLTQRTGEWTPKRQVRSLPGPLEFLRIMAAACLPTSRLKPSTQRLEPPQRRLLWAATRWFGTMVAALLLVASALGWWLWDMNGQTVARRLVKALDNRTHSDFRRLVAEQLPQYRHWVVGELQRTIEQQPSEGQDEDEHVPMGRRRADAVIALVRLKVFDALSVFNWREAGDPEAATQFVDRARDRGVTLDELVHLYEHAMASGDDSTRYTVLLTFGTFPERAVNQSRRQQVGDQLNLSAVFRDDPSSGIHSAAGWLLRTWNLATPQLEPRDLSDASPNWFVKQVVTNQSRDEMTFVRVPRGEFVRRAEGSNASDQPVALTRDYWLADREVTVGLFRQFVESVGAVGSEYRQQCPSGEIPAAWTWRGENTDASPTVRHPVQNVDWNDAVLFCNWLSRGERRSPCYKASPAGDWMVVPDANGYRLPTEAEWEYACRAGTLTLFSCGSDEATLKRYAVFEAQSAAEGGTQMPSPWGLFDVHGNVLEWCQDWYENDVSGGRIVDPTGPAKGSFRVYRGGSWSNSPWGCRSAYRRTFDPMDRSISLGFRVALNSSEQESSPRAAQPRSQ